MWELYSVALCVCVQLQYGVDESYTLAIPDSSDSENVASLEVSDWW